MADSSVPITAGSGTSIDTRTEATNGNHRQVVVLGDPSTNAGVAPVDATNGLSVTLTTALPAGSSAIGKLAANSGVDIGDVDVTSVGTITPGTAASSLGKAEDAAHTTGDVGVMGLSVRQDTAAALADTDADYQPLITDASGRLHVNVGTSALPSGAATSANQSTANTSLSNIDSDTSAIQTSVELIDDAIKTDDAAFTPATTKIMMAGFEFDDVATDSVDEGDSGAARMSANRNIYTQIRDAAGNERGANVNASNQLSVSVDNTVTVASHAVTNAGTFVVQENGAALTALQLIDDGVYTDDTSTHSTGTSKGYGIMAAATPTDGSVNANDIGMVAMTTDRKLHVSVQDALPAGTAAIGKLAANSGVDIGDVDVTSIIPGTGATNSGKAEDAAHTTGDTGTFSLGVRNDTPNTATTNTNADYSQLSTDMVGGIRTALYETDFAVLGTNHVKKYYTSTGAVTDGIIWSPAAGKRWYVTDIFINVSAAATVTLEDDKAGGDEVVWKAELAANSGWSHHYGTPLFSGEDAADLLVTTSAGNVYCTVVGYEI